MDELLRMSSCAAWEGESLDREKFLTVFQPELIRRVTHLSGFACQFSIQHYNMSLYSHFGIPLPDSIKRSVLKRQAEYLAGRVVADLAIKNLHLSSSVVSIGLSREPVWPKPVVGSISHTANTACAVVAMKDSVRSVGVDIESYICPKVLKDIEHTIFDLSEVSLLKSSEIEDYSIAATVAFSAKESLFKALFPLVHHYFGFDCARLVSISQADGTFKLELTSDLSTNEFLIGHQFQGHFEIFDRKAMTLISILT